MESGVDPQILDRAFDRVTHEKELAKVSKQLDYGFIQSSASFRTRERALACARLCFDEKGRLDDAAIGSAIKEIQAHFYSLGPNRQPDAHAMAHLVMGLSHLSQNKQVRKIVHSLGSTTGGVVVQNAIRADLQLSGGTRIEERHVKQAAVAAYLTRLRQSVGSCFGTAPAMMIQAEQPIQFFTDLSDLFARGKLTRVVAGTEFSVPICFSPGLGDLVRPYPLSLGMERFLSAPGVQRAATVANLTIEAVAKWLATRRGDHVTVYEMITDLVPDSEVSQAAFFAFRQVTDNAVLKHWEFTLASFAESTDHFSKWHLYTALGFDSDEPGGIGECIVARINENLDQMNREIDEGRAKHDILLGAAKGLESRIRSADSSQLGWIRGDYDQKVGELHRIEDELNHTIQRGHLLSRLLPFLAKEYTRLLPDYFQEIYDPEMHDVSLSEFDDQPAGFRLVYKSGLSDPGLWERIDSASGFTTAIANFLKLTEGILLQQDETKGIDQEVSIIITAVIHHISTPVFIESAFNRLARRYGLRPIKQPLDHLDKIEKKPWSHISGGTMRHMLSTYYSREEEPTVRGRPVTSSSDLLIMVLDILKETPPSVTDQFVRNPLGSLLMQSPTHAFSLKPGLPLVLQGWSHAGNTYTWVRDQIVRPAQGFVETQILEGPEIAYLIDRLATYLPPNLVPTYRHALQGFPNRIPLLDFKSMVLDQLPQPVRHTSLPAIIDSVLYASVPFVKSGELPQAVLQIMPDLKIKVARNKHPIPANKLQDLCQALYIEHAKVASTPNDVAWEIRLAMRQNDRALPQPCVFADSNWSTDFFSMVVSPSTGLLELWRTDYLGLTGSPMSSWDSYLNGSTDQPWLVYTQPHEYVRYL